MSVGRRRWCSRSSARRAGRRSYAQAIPVVKHTRRAADAAGESEWFAPAVTNRARTSYHAQAPARRGSNLLVVQSKGVDGIRRRTRLELQAEVCEPLPAIEHYGRQTS